MAILSCEALSKTYRPSGETAAHAVQEISLAFEQGSFTAITGPSGSGKSTLLHMLGALEYPTGGKVFFQNADLFAYNDNQLSAPRRRRFGFVFQAYNLVRELTGYENILLPVMLDKRAPDEAYIGRSHRHAGNPRPAWTTCPARFPAASSSAFPSPARWPTSPPYSLPTSPPATWTPRPAAKCFRCCGRWWHEFGITLILVSATTDGHSAEQADLGILSLRGRQSGARHQKRRRENDPPHHDAHGAGAACAGRRSAIFPRFGHFSGRVLRHGARARLREPGKDHEV